MLISEAKSYGTFRLVGLTKSTGSAHAAAVNIKTKKPKELAHVFFITFPFRICFVQHKF
jgi:hypothetical protein